MDHANDLRSVEDFEITSRNPVLRSMLVLLRPGGVGEGLWQRCHLIPAIPPLTLSVISKLIKSALRKYGLSTDKH